jgi:hypothetical protein
MVNFCLSRGKAGGKAQTDAFDNTAEIHAKFEGDEDNRSSNRGGVSKSTLC